MRSRKMLWLAGVVILSLLFGCNLPGTAPTEIPIPVDEVPAMTNDDTSSIPAPIPGNTIDPMRLEYLGAFRLPEGGDRPFTFAYGGNAMTFNPDGDPAGGGDGFPGTLFITGHDRLPYGELPDGSRVAEISIPAPILSRDVNALNRAGYIQELTDVTAGHFTEMEEIVRTGLLYLDAPATGPLIHITWGQHIEPDPTAATQGWFSPDLANPDFQGPWFIAGQSWYNVNDYMFEIPAEWANTYLGGQVVATGRFKDGGWSGMGPVVIAYRPWDEDGNPYPPGTEIPATALLHYATSVETDQIERCLNDYQHPDEWSGGAWLTTSDGRSAVLFAGAKSNGDKYWYGYIDQDNPTTPCVDVEVTDFTTCRLRDGTPCPPEDFDGCANHNENRGWWSTRWDTQFLFYDPADLARVASGELASWEPQPYAVLDIDEVMYFNPSGVEPSMIGSGDQRRYRIGDVAYDRQNGLLYVLELYADEAAPVVHVWKVR